LVENSNIKANQKILDVGCGRGASLYPAIKKIGIDGVAIGIDTSEKMIEYTQSEINKEICKNIILDCVDLESFKDNENSFDYIQCGFGLGYIDADKENYNKIHSLLKKDGVFAISSWTHQEDQDWMTSLVNKCLEIESTNKDVSPLSTEDGVKEILENASFNDIETMTIEKVFCFRDKEEWWNDLNSTAVRNILDVISENGKLEEFKKEAFEGLDQFENMGTIQIKRKAILAYCRT